MLICYLGSATDFDFDIHARVLLCHAKPNLHEAVKLCTSYGERRRVWRMCSDSGENEEWMKTTALTF